MVEKKHILFIVQNNPVPFDVRVWSEAKAMKDFGYEVSIICPEDKKTFNKKRIIDGIFIYRHPQPLEGAGKLGLLTEYLNSIFWELLLSIVVFTKNRFHIIHGANPPDHIFFIAILYKLFGVKYIFDQHDIVPENYIAKFNKNGLLYYISLIMEKLTYKTADIVISTNKSYKNIAINRGKIHKSNVFVVRNGPDLDKIKIYNPDNILIENGFDYLVGYVGTIGQQEGIENLIEIANYIVYEKEIHSIRFIVIGTGPHLKNIIELCKRKNLEKYVRFTGYVPDEKLYQILSSVDVCVNPEFKNSFTDKSTMIKIMEYMAFGKPIVQYGTTEGKYSAGNSALNINDNNNKKFSEALIELLNDKKKRKYMGEYGRERIIKFLQWKIQKYELKKVYEYLEKSYN